MFSNKSLINYDNQRRIFCVRAGKGAPLQDGNFHRLEIVRIDDEIAAAGMVAARKRRSAADHERRGSDISD